MARGYEGQFGHLLNAPYVWIPLALALLLRPLRLPPPRRMVHLDLLVLLSFGVSQFFFDRGDIGVSVPLVYPPLVYLLVPDAVDRLQGPARRPQPLDAAHLARDRDDVPDRLPRRAQRRRLGRDRRRLRRRRSAPTRPPTASPSTARAPSPTTTHFGDTYGPANYYAYVPFELAMPWDGEWDELAAGPRRGDLLRPGDGGRPVLPRQAAAAALAGRLRRGAPRPRPRAPASA